ncbi:MAG: DNA-binding response regulator [Epsilonproteobacteria bacterium]|nr:MAG: DNA-binding response regulator [Campylobacterota bacterium]
MNILIVEDEVYLAQKVAARLQDDGYNTTHLASIKDIDYDINYDSILLSTNLAGNYEEVIKKYSSSIIILLVTYVSEATVTKPIQAGASDYVLKPFMMDELVRKIKHFEEFNILKKENKKTNNYLEFIFNSISIPSEIPSSLPFLIETNEQKIADKIVFDYARKLELNVKFVSLKKIVKIEPTILSNELLYIYDFHTLKASSKKSILKSCENANIIICSAEKENIEFSTLTVMTENKISTIDSILTVNDYVKQITLNFQSKYPDTELSRRLGISRKSLWEKRKKFGIEKKSQEKLASKA